MLNGPNQDSPAQGAGAALDAGDAVAGVELVEKLAEGGGVRLWRAKGEGDRPAVAYILLVDDPEVRRRFVEAAEEMAKRARALEGILKVTAVDPDIGAYAGDFAVKQTLAKPERLDFTQDEVLTFMSKLGAVIAKMHEQGVIHGCLRPECVLIDADGEPVVANAKGFDIGEMCRTDPAAVSLFSTYAPQEQRFGRSASSQSDVFSLGRFFHLVLMGAEPDEKDETLPRLDSLDRKPNGVRRIIRACVAGDLDKRYGRAMELVEDIERFRKHEPVGLPHPAFDKVAAVKRREQVLEERRKSGKAKKRSPEVIVVQQAAAPEMAMGKRIALIVTGVLIMAIPTLVAYLTSNDSVFFSLTTFISIIPIGVAVPGFGRPPMLGQVLVATLILGALVFGDPARRAAEAQAATAGLRAEALEQRVEAFREAVAAGEMELRQVNLDGADLSGMKLRKIALDGGSLRGANLQNADLSDASMWNVDVEGADVSGATLEGVIPTVVKNWALMKCDDATTMPFGWECRDGNPAFLIEK